MALLLDTCALIFIANGQSISQGAKDQVLAAGLGDGIFVSSVSAWEIGLLSTRKAIDFHPDPKTWFGNFLSQPGVRLTPLTPEIAIDSCRLPAPPRLHGDPADRLLIATARALDVPIVTRDRRILDYAKTGLVMGIAC